MFANARAIVGPVSDAAGLRDAADFSVAAARIAGANACWLVNHHDGLRELQERVLTGAVRPDCVIDEPGNIGPAAVRAAQIRGAYTVWGYHPFMRLHTDGMQAFAFGDRFLLRPLKVWMVSNGTEKAAARRAIEALLRADVQQRVAEFRLPQDPVNQAWWPAAEVE